MSHQQDLYTQRPSLLLFDPPSERGRVLDSGITALVEVVLYLGSPSTWRSAGEIAEDLHSLFEMSFGSAEIEHAINVIDPPNITRGVGQTATYQLITDARRSKEREEQEAVAIENAVLSEWISQNEEFQQLSRDEIEWFKKELLNVNSKLLIKYALKLSQDENGNNLLTVETFDELTDQTFFTDSNLKQLFLGLAVNFWKNSTSLRDAYVSKLFDRAFMLSALSVDSASSRLLLNAWGYTSIYIDTNVAFSVLNFEGPAKYFQIRLMLNLAKEAGVSVKIPRRTIKELQSALMRHQKDAIRYPISDEALARLASTYMSEESFLNAYNQRFGRKTTSPLDFSSYVRNVDLYLRAEGIEIDEEDYSKTELYQLNRENHLHYLQISGSQDVYVEESEIKAEHDFFMWCAVMTHRDSNSSSFADMKCWLVTYHARLRSYDKFSRNHEMDAPYHLTPAKIVQVLRLILPRSNDDNMDKQFCQLLRSAFLRTTDGIKDIVLQKLAAVLNSQVNNHRITTEESQRLYAVLAVDKVLASEIEKRTDVVEISGFINSTLARKATEAVESEKAAEQKSGETEELYVDVLRRAEDAEARAKRAELHLRRMKKKGQVIEVSAQQKELFDEPYVQTDNERIVALKLYIVDSIRIISALLICIIGYTVFSKANCEWWFSIWLKPAFVQSCSIWPGPIVVALGSLVFLVKWKRTTISVSMRWFFICVLVAKLGAMIVGKEDLSTFADVVQIGGIPGVLALMYKKMSDKDKKSKSLQL